MQDSGSINFARGGNTGCPRKRFDGKERVGRGGGYKLDVRGGDEQLCVVVAVERPAIEGANAQDSDLRFPGGFSVLLWTYLGPRPVPRRPGRSGPRCPSASSSLRTPFA